MEAAGRCLRVFFKGIILVGLGFVDWLTWNGMVCCEVRWYWGGYLECIGMSMVNGFGIWAGFVARIYGGRRG